MRLVAIAEVSLRMRYYAVGDIHGRADLLADMQRRIATDLRHYAGEATVIYLGDYVDRGPDTRGVIDRLIACRLGSERVYLKGNHEDMLLQFLDKPSKYRRWLNVGGLQAARSYGLTGSPVSDNDLIAFAAELGTTLPEAHVNFLKSLQLSHTTERYFFCHAGVRPGTPLAKQDAHDLMWIKADFLEHRKSFGKVVVHGHSPGDVVDIRPNRIDVDTRAHATGRLSCVVLEDGEASVRVLATEPSRTLLSRLAALFRWR